MRNLWVVVFLITVSVILIIIGCVSHGDESVAEDAKITDKEVRKQAIHVRDLADQGNPYKGQYGAYDVWAYNNIVEEPEMYYGTAPEGMVTFSSYVTEDGYLIPQIEFVHWCYERAKNGDDTRCELSEYSVVSQGMMDEHQWLDYSLAVAAEVANFYEPVPDWVAANPPESGMMMPNGDVLFIENPKEDEDSSCCGASGSTIYRYSRDGELIRTARQYWWMTYFDGNIENLPEGTMRIRRDGYVIFTDCETEEVLSVWDWDGTRLDLDYEPSLRDYTPFIQFTGEKMMLMNQANSI